MCIKTIIMTNTLTIKYKELVSSLKDLHSQTYTQGWCIDSGQETGKRQPSGNQGRGFLPLQNVYGRPHLEELNPNQTNSNTWSGLLQTINWGQIFKATQQTTTVLLLGAAVKYITLGINTCNRVTTKHKDNLENKPLLSLTDGVFGLGLHFTHHTSTCQQKYTLPWQNPAGWMTHKMTLRVATWLPLT